MIKAIFSDCFGVVYPELFKHVREDHPEKFHKPQEFFINLARQSDLGEIGQNDVILGIAENSDYSEEEVRDMLSFKHLPKQDVIDVLMSFKGKVDILGVLSNVNREYLDELLATHNLAQYFEPILASSELKAAKPDKEIFQKAASRVGLDTGECIFIDDRPPNVAGAGRAGMHGIHFVGDTNKLKQDISNLINKVK